MSQFLSRDGEGRIKGSGRILSPEDPCSLASEPPGQQGAPGSTELIPWGWACHHGGHPGAFSSQHKVAVQGHQAQDGPKAFNTNLGLNHQ